jgi:hypothetical protein
MRALRICEALLIALALVLCVAVLDVAVHGQTADLAERFTFIALKAPKSIVDGDRLTITLDRWSTDAERDKVVAAFTDGGTNGVLGGVRDSGAIGYLRWPGGLEYAVRYARRIPQPDGGLDVILITDRPLWVWWDSSVTANHNAPFSAVLLKMRKNGVGEGVMAMPESVTSDKANGVAIKNPSGLPALLSDVRRSNS